MDVVGWRDGGSDGSMTQCAHCDQVMPMHDLKGHACKFETNARPGLTSSVRTFDSGATRDIDAGKYDYEGFLSPIVLECYARYMHAHMKLPDGTLRASDNWQKSIPRDQYIKSLIRHVIDLWRCHRDPGPCFPGDLRERMEDSLCAVIFNAQGYLYEYLNGR